MQFTMMHLLYCELLDLAPFMSLTVSEMKAISLVKSSSLFSNTSECAWKIFHVILMVSTSHIVLGVSIEFPIPCTV